MKIIRLSKSGTVIGPVYHGTISRFNKFDVRKTAQGIFWFTEDKDALLRGEVGIDKPKYIITATLNIENPAGWKEYDKLMLQQIHDRGFDSIHLDDNWVVFDSEDINILSIDAVE